ncbi:MAG: amidohydrolase [Deltaproteobacteria bacterium]|nr:amidohydrolase [Kofleriaceae bacterium]
MSHRLLLASVLALALVSAPARGPATASIVVDGRTLPVVDMHLHAGDYATMAPTGKAFIAANLPPAFALYAPELFDRLNDPYAPHVGIAAQTELAGVDHAVLYAVYTQHTTGYFTNEALEAALLDARNATDGDAPWAFGFASIDFDGWDTDVAGERLEALRSYFVAHPQLFKGIKLAHAHQQVPFTDPAYQGVYQVAAEVGVPVLLHTGFSPFPGAATDPAYYDPLGLEAVITTFDGEHGAGRVEFVLSHVGQGDARAVAHALDLAAAHDNVWLELSALGRPLAVGLDGEPVTSTEPQYPYVIAQIRARGLIARTLFATDGPQFSGAVRTYLQRIVAGMQDAGYTTDEIAAVLAGNVSRLCGMDVAPSSPEE